jgi:cyd operon protein YbgT
MWYFSWVLGVGLAVAFGILNGLWHEILSSADEDSAI